MKHTPRLMALLPAIALLFSLSSPVKADAPRPAESMSLEQSLSEQTPSSEPTPPKQSEQTPSPEQNAQERPIDETGQSEHDQKVQDLVERFKAANGNFPDDLTRDELSFLFKEVDREILDPIMENIMAHALPVPVPDGSEEGTRQGQERSHQFTFVDEFGVATEGTFEDFDRNLIRKDFTRFGDVGLISHLHPQSVHTSIYGLNVAHNLIMIPNLMQEVSFMRMTERLIMEVVI